MYELVKELFPICRSITGNGVRQTLKILQHHIPLKMVEVATGTKVFDWTVPMEWNVQEAYLLDPTGKKIIDFRKNNLHLVSYSIPINKTIPLADLEEHLYSLPEQPMAIPYITSYYQKRWGFCLAHRDRVKLKAGNYQVVIDSELKNGSLTYGEVIIPGRSKKEIFLSTYICHPSLANNELSGPAVAAFLVKQLLEQPRRYTYRVIFIPETIGSLVYLSRHLRAMKRQVIAGFNLSCLGDDGAYSYLPTRPGNTYADKIALNVLSFKHPNFLRYSFLDRGSDERQYNAPGVDLPVVSLSRSKYGTYPEYHTSLDNLDFISPEGLFGSYELVWECLEAIEGNYRYRLNCLGEPQLGRRGLYPTITTTKVLSKKPTDLLNFIAYADGQNDLLDISNQIQVPVGELLSIVEKLRKAKLLSRYEI
ncbi:MAG TPA: DUF4910 domain-containing protein [Candidatus Paceibacterota bacterium]